MLPKSILQSIEKICRAFIWSGNSYSSKPGNVAWEHLCKDKKAGGLGFRNIITWNMACMSKYVWAVATKQDNLWVKWVHAVYIKDAVWWDYSPSPGASWYWNKICEMKNHIRRHYTKDDFYALTQYKVGEIYDVLMGDQISVYWDTMVWNRLSIPRYRFINWLAVQHKLQTTERLVRIGVSSSDQCLICSQGSESHTHLFFECDYSRICLSEMKRWLGISAITNNLNRLIVWIATSKKSKFKREVWNACLSALVYSIWKSRNDAYWNMYITMPHLLIDTLKRIVKERIRAVMPKKIARQDFVWFMSL